MKNNKKIRKNKFQNNNDINLKSSKFDPFGSYTGVSADGEKPVQDQDDLWKNHHSGGFLLQMTIKNIYKHRKNKYNKFRSYYEEGTTNFWSTLCWFIVT